MAEAAPPLALGQVIDAKWRVESLLGRGGMGAVYSAFHVRNQRKVAIKVLNADLARDPEQRARLQREGYAANRIDHPGIVAIIDDGVMADGAVYLVMERLEGVALDALAEARGGRLGVEEGCALFEAWLEVVAAAHAQGVVHRDLKPENAFFTRQGRLKVLDFGLAQIREEGSARLTATGVPMGTPAFMPPEQALAYWDRVDARSDVFALAASFFTLLTGKLVHDAQTMPELLVWVCTRQAAPVRAVAPFIPPPVAEVMDRALSFQSSDRFEDAHAMLVAFRLAVVNARLVLPALQTLAREVHDATSAAPMDEATTPDYRFAHGMVSEVTALFVRRPSARPLNAPSETAVGGEGPQGRADGLRTSSAIRPLASATVSPVSTAQRGFAPAPQRGRWLVPAISLAGLGAVAVVAYCSVTLPKEPVMSVGVEGTHAAESVDATMSTSTSTAPPPPIVELARPATSLSASATVPAAASGPPKASSTAKSHKRAGDLSAAPPSAQPNGTVRKDPLGWN